MLQASSQTTMGAISKTAATALWLIFFFAEARESFYAKGQILSKRSLHCAKSGWSFR